MRIKIEIKNRWTGSVLFEYEKEDNTVKDTVVEAVKKGADLRDAYLRGADLGGADLGDAYLRGADLGGADLGDANLRDADLRGAYLGDAYLRGAYLHGADLRDAYLRDAYLRGADLGGANLRDAYLRDAYLRGADLGDAYLRDADLRGADLGDANLRDADLRGADLGGAKEIPFIPLACPSDGAFIAWKKVAGHLVKLEIPEDARRCSATSNKCRCDKAKVLEITRIEDGVTTDEIVNESYRSSVTYKVGEMVFPDSFDENRWNECSHGIHFFINKDEAINFV